MMKLLELAEEAASKEVPVNLISEAITPEFEPELGVTSDGTLYLYEKRGGYLEIRNREV